MHPIEKRSLDNHAVTIGRLLLEMAMIVFGILLALNLETCKERRYEHRLAATALRNIRMEVEQNRAAVAANLPRHREFMASLQKEIARVERLRSAAKGPLPEEGMSIALEPTILYGKAWETATLTQALAREDFRVIMSLAAVYESQRWMKLIEDKWLESVLDPSSFEMSRRHWFLAILQTLVNNYIGLEESLLTAYDDILANTLPARAD